MNYTIAAIDISSANPSEQFSKKINPHFYITFRLNKNFERKLSGVLNQYIFHRISASRILIRVVPCKTPPALR